MKVELDFKQKECRVIKESGDKNIALSGWVKDDGGDPNSRLYYHIQQILNKEGYKIIKKRMWKDGHLVDAERQYLATRNPKGQNFCIYDNLYAIRDAREEYNKEGKVTLCLDPEVGFEERCTGNGM